MSAFVGGIRSKLVDMLDVLAEQQRVLSHNIANANTEGYKRKDIDFEKVLQGAKEEMHLELAKTHPRHLDSKIQPSGAGGHIIQTDKPVELDEEIVNITKNAMAYRMYTELLGNQFRQISWALRGNM